MFRIGVIGDSLRLPLRESILRAKGIGADGIARYAAAPELDPETTPSAARAELREFCRAHGVGFASLIGEPGGHGLEREEENSAKLPRLKAILDLAADLGAEAVTGHIGVIPADRTARRSGILREACVELGRHATRRGVRFGIETGPEPAEVLRRFLDDLAEPGVGANLDPANLVMVQREDPVRAVELLAPHLVAVHAKDGRNLRPCDAEEVYAAFAEGGFDALLARTGALFEELPLGRGAVPWRDFLGALERCGFRGWLTIERETGVDPCAEVAEAVRFLRDLTA